MAQPILSFSQSSGPGFRVWIGTSQILTLDAPRAEGSRVVFHRYPDRLFMSARTADVVLVETFKAQSAAPSPNEGAETRMSESVVVSAPGPSLRPGEVVDIGLTGDGSDLLRERASALAAKAAAAEPVRRPGEGARGKALFNPNRDYRPEWDSKLVPGYSMPYANSPNDLLEGKTLSYPPGSGRQLSLGAPPTLIDEGVETPKVLSRPGGWGPPSVGPSISPPVTAERGSDVPRVPDVHDVPRVSYDPNLPPPRRTWPTPAAPPKKERARSANGRRWRRASNRAKLMAR